MRMFVFGCLAVLLASCATKDQDLGSVIIKTDAKGKIASVQMEKSTGSAKVDNAVMKYARVTFRDRLSSPRPNHVYRHVVSGNLEGVDERRYIYPTDD